MGELGTAQRADDGRLVHLRHLGRGGRRIGLLDECLEPSYRCAVERLAGPNAAVVRRRLQANASWHRRDFSPPGEPSAAGPFANARPGHLHFRR